MKHGSGDMQCSVPLQSPVNFSFDPHDGSVHSIEYSPYHRNLFLTSASDCTARIYSLLQASQSDDDDDDDDDDDGGGGGDGSDGFKKR